MSNATSDSQGSGHQRRRSRGGKGRSRNRQNQDGSPRNDNRGDRGDNRDDRGDRGDNRGRQGRQEGGPTAGSRSRRPEPVKLTFWQKLLKAVGLYKEPERPARPPRTGVKENTRNARTGDESAVTRPPREAREAPEPRERREPREPRERREPREGRERRNPERAEVGSNRLYLGNLSYDATESDLEELFKGVGSVRTVEIVYNRATHRSKGYGFVDMLNLDEAKRAVEVLHDQFFMGRQLVVSGAKSQGPEGESDEDDRDENTTQTPQAVAEVADTPEAVESTATNGFFEAVESTEATDGTVAESDEPKAS